MLNDMVKKLRESFSPDYKEIGHPQEFFDESYWTSTIGDGSGKSLGKHARISRQPVNIFKLMKSLALELNLGSKFTVMDFGAGAGNTVNYFKTHGVTTLGCEYSIAGRKLALEKFGVHLDELDLREPLRYVTDQFDLSLCAGVISMIPRSKMNIALGEMLRVTKYCVYVYAGLQITDTLNPHHVTSMTEKEYDEVVNSVGGHIWNSSVKSSPEKFGVGIGSRNGTELSKLYSKTRFTELT